MEAFKKRVEMKLLELHKLSEEAVKDLTSSFGKLPKTNHADGQYRLRRYSVVRASGQGNITRLPNNSFNQSSKFNKFQGDVERHFESIEGSVINSEGMKEMFHLFLQNCDISGDTRIDVHQMRVITLSKETQVSPEGAHQDGYDHISMIGINRHNIKGGEILVYNCKDKDKTNEKTPFFNRVLDAGDMIILDDKKFWHNANSIVAKNSKKLGYMDLFVLTARKKSKT